MLDAMKFFSIDKVRTGALMATVLVFPAMAQTGDDTRGVRIIDGPPSAPVPAPSPLLEAPAPTLPPLVAPPSSNPTPLVAAPPPVPAPTPPAAVLAPPAAPAAPTRIAVPSAAPPEPLDFGALQSNIKVANSAEVSIDILPGPDITVGSHVSFRISTKKPGYLILVDVDSTGKLTQIYPNSISLMANSAARQNANYVRPGKPVQIPNPADPYAGFEFVASAPFGTAMVVAILSDRPVHLVDLPDIPTSMTGQASAVAFLTKLASDLRIPEGDGGRLQEARWSFDAKFYAIR
jgi:hypothetical protein